MKVYICWSGDRSKEIATELRKWLPNVIQTIQPWMSDVDIKKGARWQEDISNQLKDTKLGIICLTPENLNEPWILFEAGALSKTIEKTFVCTYLFEIEPSDIKPPLSQFQATQAQKEDTKKLIYTLNNALEDKALPEKQVDKTFELWWPELEDSLKKIPIKTDETVTKRSDREILEEILSIVRSLANQGYLGLRSWIKPQSKSDILMDSIRDSIRSSLLRYLLKLPETEGVTLTDLLRGESLGEIEKELPIDKEKRHGKENDS